MGRYLHRATISAVLLFFFAVPLGFILYGGAAAAIGGLVIIAILIAIQLPAFIIARRMGLLPSSKQEEDG